MGDGICSRCGEELSENSDVFLAALRKTCFNFLLSSCREKLVDCLDSLDKPAAILACNHTVILSNELLEDSSKLEAGKPRIGEVLNCVNAALLGRCGETVGCFLCGLRKLVKHTQRTGEKLSDMRVNLQNRSGANQTLLLSTEKAGSGVLIIIETPPGEGQ